MRAPTIPRFALLAVALALADDQLSAPAMAAPGKSLTVDDVRAAPAKVVTIDNVVAAPEIKVVRDWAGALCRTRIVNEGKVPVRVKEIVLFDIPHAYPLQTHLYGEG